MLVRFNAPSRECRKRLHSATPEISSPEMTKSCIAHLPHPVCSLGLCKPKMSYGVPARSRVNSPICLFR
jgi:hypothetical protein